MSILELLLIALGVSIDAFSVSVSGSFCDRTGKVLRNALRAALYFGTFQFLMPLAGFLAAGLLTSSVEKYGHWIAFALLLFVGGKMTVDGWQKRKEKSQIECKTYDFFGWKVLVFPAVATSIDAFAVGAGLAFAGKSLLAPCLSMGVVTAVISFAGVYTGSRLARIGKAFLPEWIMLMTGGCAIVLVGAKILYSGLVR